MCQSAALVLTGLKKPADLGSESCSVPIHGRKRRHIVCGRGGLVTPGTRQNLTTGDRGKELKTSNLHKPSFGRQFKVRCFRPVAQVQDQVNPQEKAMKYDLKNDWTQGCCSFGNNLLWCHLNMGNVTGWGRILEPGAAVLLHFLQSPGNYGKHVASSQSWLVYSISQQHEVPNRFPDPFKS